MKPYAPDSAGGNYAVLIDDGRACKWILEKNFKGLCRNKFAEAANAG